MKRLLILLLLTTTSLFAQDDFVVQDIEIIGNFRTREWVVRRELGFDVGDRILIDDLDAARNRLLSLQIFNNAFIEVNDEGTVVVEVSEQFRFIPLLGLAATDGRTQDAFSDFGMFFEIMTVTAGVADLNHRGSGALADVAARFGATTGFAANYSTRWLSPHLPISFRCGVRNLIVSDKHAAVLDSSRRLHDRRTYLEAGSRRGKKARFGAALQIQEVREENAPPAEGRDFLSFWMSPFLVLDHRDLEWYPSRGVFAKIAANAVAGDEVFSRSQFDLRGFFPLNNRRRPPVLAMRLNGGTSSSSTPAWAHYYFGFSRLLRGYSSEKSEASTVMVGDLELRIPCSRETTYDVPLLGRNGRNIPFWWGLVLFAERAQLQLDGAREETWAVGAGVHLRVPYIQIVELSWAVNRDGKGDILIQSGASF